MVRARAVETYDAGIHSGRDTKMVISTQDRDNTCASSEKRNSAILTLIVINSFFTADLPLIPA